MTKRYTRKSKERFKGINLFVISTKLRRLIFKRSLITLMLVNSHRLIVLEQEAADGQLSEPLIV